jgi:hypothetical protein
MEDKEEEDGDDVDVGTPIVAAWTKREVILT